MHEASLLHSVGQRQSTATARASQISLIRASLRRPMRSVSTPTETLSIESRLTAVRRPTGSSPGSRTTSLAKPRIVVVHGAITARRSRGIAASRERTTTGRRPISGGSHHQSSPRNGSVLTWRPRPIGTTEDRPTHRAHRWDDRRRRDSRRRSPQRGSEQGAQRVRRRKELHRCAVGSLSWPRTGGSRQLLCSLAIGPWHKYGIDMPHREVVELDQGIRQRVETGRFERYLNG